MNAIDLMATSLADYLDLQIRDYTKGLRPRERKEISDRALVILRTRSKPAPKKKPPPPAPATNEDEIL